MIYYAFIFGKTFAFHLLGHTFQRLILLLEHFLMILQEFMRIDRLVYHSLPIKQRFCGLMLNLLLLCLLHIPV